MRYPKLFLLLIFASALLFLNGAPVRNLALDLTQPDGTHLRLYASGDEFYNWLHDADNFTVMKNGSGWYVYAEKQGDKLIPGSLLPGRDVPSSRGIVAGLNLSQAEIAAKYDRYRDSMRDYSNGRAPHSGLLNNLVAFIRFADDPPFSQPIGTYEDMFNSSVTNANSMKNYFQAASYQQLTIESHFYPAPNGTTIVCYVDSLPRNYYRPLSAGNTIGYDPNDDDERTMREHTLLANCINSIASGIPETIDFDGDDDGYVDNVCFIVQGSPDGWAELLWPHRWSLYGATAFLHGAQVWDFNLQLETFLTSEGASVLSHEMFHSLGAPDLYRYYDSTITPIGGWDLMASNSNPPQHMSAWMKFRYGQWLPTPTMITQSGEYSLSPVATSSTNNIYRVPSWRNNESFLLEYRKPGSYYDQTLPGTGLLVYRLDNREEGNASGPPDELYIYRPGGTDNLINGTLSQAAFSANNNRTMLNESTSPTPFLGNGASGGLNLYDIGQIGDTITFKIKISDIQITYPRGSETWFSGSSKVITWKAKSSTGSVRIDFSSDDGATWQTVTPSTLNTGSYTWTNVTATDSDLCRIKITHLTSNQFDTNTYPFSVISEMEIPTPVYPADGSANVPTNPTFSWTLVPGATSYNIQVSTDPGFASYVINLLEHDSNTYQYSGLTPYTTYYWQVCANSELGEGLYSDVDSFTTGQLSEYPAVPAMVGPANNATGVPMNPILSWTSAYLASDYHLQISTSPYFATLAYEQDGITATSYQCPALSANTSYYWRVRAHNVMGYSNFTSNRKFTTGSTVDNEDVVGTIFTNRLDQNSPNPFNPNTSISYELKDTKAPVILAIYNQKGQLVRTLVNGLIQENRGSIIWDGKDDRGRSVNSGIYLYRLLQGDFISTRKMLLLK